jgi:hypothetical protein
MIHIRQYRGLVDLLTFSSYIRARAFGFIKDTSYDNNITIMSAHLPSARSRIFLEARRFRLVADLDDCICSQVTERAAPLVRLEGPDISLSGRQILLKLLG